MADPSDRGPGRSELGTVLLATYAVVVALVGAYIYYSGVIYSTPDANAGLGLGVVALVLLGIPWSGVPLLLAYLGASEAVVMALVVLSVLANLGLLVRWAFGKPSNT